MSNCDILTGVTASAGSKVLIAGGYLVLHQPHIGIVLGVDARLNTSVYQLPPNNERNPVILGNATGHYAKTCSDTVSFPIIISTLQRTLNPIIFTVRMTRHPDDVRPDAPKREYIIKETEFSNKWSLEMTGDVDQNPFLAKTIQYSLIVIASLLTYEKFWSYVHRGLLITARGDRSFYSSAPVPDIRVELGQTVPLAQIYPSSESEKGILEAGNKEIQTQPIYFDHPKDYQTKTGMGSSAALVSSAVAALFSYFGLLPAESSLPPLAQDPSKPPHPPISTFHSKLIAYHVAQTAHCIAQGKVGSGFDISTAFYGTQIYRRFSSDIIAPLLPNAGAYGFAQQDAALVLSTIFQKWDDSVLPFQLPVGLNVVIADVQGGSETPSMVKKVEAWREHASDEERTAIWDTLATTNKQFEQQLDAIRVLTKSHPTTWLAIVRSFQRTNHTNWSVQTCLDDEVNANENLDRDVVQSMVDAISAVRQTFATIRSLLKQLGEKSDVPIEPDSQSTLLNTTQEQPGVLFAGVPGAGGFDAAFAIIFDSTATTSAAQLSVLNTPRDEVDSKHVVSNLVQVWKQLSVSQSTDNIDTAAADTGTHDQPQDNVELNAEGAGQHAIKKAKLNAAVPTEAPAVVHLPVVLDSQPGVHASSAFISLSMLGNAHRQ